MNAALRQAIERAFSALAADGWITTTEPDRTGVVCRGFDANPSAPGFAAVVLPTQDDHALFEVGVGVGDEDGDLAAAEIVATALRSAGLTTTTELREGAAYATASLPAADTPEALAQRVAAFIRAQHGLPSGEVVHVVLHDDNGKVLWRGDAK